MVYVEAFRISICGKKNQRVLVLSNTPNCKTFIGNLSEHKGEINLGIMMVDDRTFFQKLKALIFEYVPKWNQLKMGARVR